MSPVRRWHLGAHVTCAPMAPGPARHLGYLQTAPGLHAVKRLVDGGHLGPNADGGTDFCAQVVLLHSTVDAVAQDAVDPPMILRALIDGAHTHLCARSARGPGTALHLGVQKQCICGASDLSFISPQAPG